MTMTREQFEAAFDSRTLAYLPGFEHAKDPLVIVVGEAAQTPAGHRLLVTLSNLVARAHRGLVYVGNLDQQLLCADVFGAGTLTESTAGLARAINPFIDVDIAATPPERSLLKVGVGVDKRAGVDLELGCDGWLALLGAGAATAGDGASVWGAFLAAVLGANAAIHRVLGRGQLQSGTFSLWDYARPSGRQGPAFTEYVDVGRVLQAGAGAVGCALDYFLALAGLAGSWWIVDGDDVDVTNLNRQMLFVARDAGFPHGTATNKAERAAKRLDGDVDYSGQWFGDDPDVVEREYDVVLALANDRGVRGFLQGRQPTVLLHATTSPNWQAQLHRHVAGRDDCIDCRLPPAPPALACSTEEIETPSGQTFDAAIPPLSALAGLLLAAELVKLQRGAMVDEAHNFTAVDLATGTPIVQRKIRQCRAGCAVRRDPPVRQAMDAHSRWVHLDGAHSGGDSP